MSGGEEKLCTAGVQGRDKRVQAELDKKWVKTNNFGGHHTDSLSGSNNLKEN